MVAEQVDGMTKIIMASTADAWLINIVSTTDAWLIIKLPGMQKRHEVLTLEQHRNDNSSNVM
jgi:hypothetical protein